MFKRFILVSLVPDGPFANTYMDHHQVLWWWEGDSFENPGTRYGLSLAAYYLGCIFPHSSGKALTPPHAGRCKVNLKPTVYFMLGKNVISVPFLSEL